MNNESEKNVAIKELNTFLKGQYMGIHAYEEYYQKIKCPELKANFQEIQQDHKQHAIAVAKRIQDLGGHPVDGPGIAGTMSEIMTRVKGLPDSDKEIVELAIKGEDDYGIQMSEKLVRGDLDKESMDLVHKILDEDRIHVSTLRKKLDTLKSKAH